MRRPWWWLRQTDAKLGRPPAIVGGSARPRRICYNHRMSEHPARSTRPMPPAGALAPEPPLLVAPLPSPPAGFIGRERELAALRGLLWRVDARLVTLTGPPGAGKTRLALQVAASLR